MFIQSIVLSSKMVTALSACTFISQMLAGWVVVRRVVEWFWQPQGWEDVRRWTDCQRTQETSSSGTGNPLWERQLWLSASNNIGSKHLYTLSHPQLQQNINLRFIKFREKSVIFYSFTKSEFGILNLLLQTIKLDFIQ